MLFDHQHCSHEVPIIPCMMASSTEISKEVMQFFWDLASVDDGERITAAKNLIETLHTRQQQYEKEHGIKREEPASGAFTTAIKIISKKDTAPKDGDDDKLYSPELAYTLKRLIRGLSSSREGARQGFALALTEACTSHYTRPHKK